MPGWLAEMPPNLVVLGSGWYGTTTYTMVAIQDKEENEDILM